MGDWSRIAIQGLIANNPDMISSAFGAKGGNINEEVTEDLEYGGIHFGCRHGHTKYGPLISKQKPGDTILDLAYRNKAVNVIETIIALGGEANNHGNGRTGVHIFPIYSIYHSVISFSNSINNKIKGSISVFD
jgi:ankyrin repeat protein